MRVTARPPSHRVRPGKSSGTAARWANAAFGAAARPASRARIAAAFPIGIVELRVSEAPSTRAVSVAATCSRPAAAGRRPRSRATTADTTTWVYPAGRVNPGGLTNRGAGCWASAALQRLEASAARSPARPVGGAWTLTTMYAPPKPDGQRSDALAEMVASPFQSACGQFGTYSGRTARDASPANNDAGAPAAGCSSGGRHARWRSHPLAVPGLQPYYGPSFTRTISPNRIRVPTRRTTSPRALAAQLRVWC